MPAHQLAVLPANRQPQPRAAIIGTDSIFGLHEGIEYTRLLRGVHADAGIANRKLPPVLPIAVGGRRREVHVPIAGELARVAQQVEEDLPEAGGVVVQWWQGGVRNSWLTLARKRLLAALASSASSLA